MDRCHELSDKTPYSDEVAANYDEDNEPLREQNYTKLHLSEPMCPFTAADGHDFPRLIDELVPGFATDRDDLLVGRKNSVG